MTVGDLREGRVSTEEVVDKLRGSAVHVIPEVTFKAGEIELDASIMLTPRVRQPAPQDKGKARRDG